MPGTLEHENETGAVSRLGGFGIPTVSDGEVTMPRAENDNAQPAADSEESLPTQEQAPLSPERQLLVQQESGKIEEELKLLVRHVFKQFTQLEDSEPGTIQSLILSGKTLAGDSIEIPAMSEVPKLWQGPLKPEIAQDLAQAFQEGKSAEQAASSLMTRNKTVQDALPREAKRRIEEKLAAAQGNMSQSGEQPTDILKTDELPGTSAARSR